MEDVVVRHTDTPHFPLVEERSHNQRPFLSHRREEVIESERIENNPFFEKTRHTSELLAEEKPRSKWVLWALAFGVVAFVSFFVANQFASATVEVTPLTYRGHLEHTFTAAKEGATTAVGGDGLTFHFISLNDEKSQNVPATIEQKIQKKAFGKVIIYNAYSTNVQRLIKNTRLESADRKIFRIDQSVVVPGAKISAGKVSQPGSVEVVAYADVPGEEYNIGISDFTIPGFRGDPRYGKFTARSKPDSPITGGFSGVVKVPGKEEVKKAQDELKQELKVTAIEKARALIPGGMTFFPGSTVLKFEETPQDFTANDTAKVSMKATVSVFFFDTALLTQKFAESALTEYQGSPVSIFRMSGLTFNFLDAVDNVILADIAQVRFQVVGDPIFIGKIDTKSIQSSLVGKDKKDFGKIIVGERNIGNAEATIRPMWKTTFPMDSSKITVKILDAVAQ